MTSVGGRSAVLVTGLEDLFNSRVISLISKFAKYDLITVRF